MRGRSPTTKGRRQHDAVDGVAGIRNRTRTHAGRTSTHLRTGDGQVVGALVVLRPIQHRTGPDVCKRLAKYVLPPVDRRCHGRCPIDRWRGRPWPGRIPIPRFRARGARASNSGSTIFAPGRRRAPRFELTLRRTGFRRVRCTGPAAGLSAGGCRAGPRKPRRRSSRVRVTAAASACRVLLPNGVVVEVPEHTERALCATVLECASRLR